MNEFYIVVGIETVAILVLAIFVNQIFHRFLSKRNLGFITPFFNIFIIVLFLLAYERSVEKVSSIPNVYLPISASNLLLYARIIAAVLAIIFAFQFIKGLIKSLKKRQNKVISDLPMLKTTVEEDLKKEHEETITTGKKICPRCGIENDLDAKSCYICTTPFETEDKQV